MPTENVALHGVESQEEAVRGEHHRVKARALFSCQSLERRRRVALDDELDVVAHVVKPGWSRPVYDEVFRLERGQFAGPKVCEGRVPF